MNIINPYFCRHQSAAILSCLHGLQARPGWLHSRCGGTSVKHAQLTVALARQALLLFYGETGCVQSIRLRRACQHALSKFCPNGALFQRLVQTGTVRPSGL